MFTGMKLNVMAELQDMCTRSRKDATLSDGFSSNRTRHECFPLHSRESFTISVYSGCRTEQPGTAQHAQLGTIAPEETLIVQYVQMEPAPHLEQINVYPVKKEPMLLKREVQNVSRAVKTPSRCKVEMVVTRTTVCSSLRMMFCMTSVNSLAQEGR